MSFPSPNLLFLSIVCLLTCDVVHGQLRTDFYSKTCPNLENVVRNATLEIFTGERRLAASILRLFFHDCFVHGCDASVLLDDTATFKGEKNAAINLYSLRGFAVIDIIKSKVERLCKETVSCADVLALAAVEGMAVVGGPRWEVVLGRRDRRRTHADDAERQLPTPIDDLPVLISRFATMNLSANDMTTLAGAHTIGFSRCLSFRVHIYNDTKIDRSFSAAHQAVCPYDSDDFSLSPLDTTPLAFDNSYFKNLVSGKGLLHSDQQLFNGGSQDALVKSYSEDEGLFIKDFKAAMEKLSRTNPLTGSDGEIRRNCRVVN